VSSFINKNPIFCECNYSFAVKDYQKTGMDILFYGQQHNDTLAVVMKDKEGVHEQVQSQ
jgi:hypothetical protein